jgi:aminoglycoside phosphotransferase (APT) family kinase protein
VHDGEHPIDEGLVRRLVADQHPRWADLPVDRVESIGTDNALFRLGDGMVVRLPRIDWAVAGVERAVCWLPRLAPQLPVPVPVPLARGAPGHGYPWAWAVTTWLDGSNPVVGALADAPHLAAEVGVFVAALHRVDVPGGPRATRGEPLRERDAETREAIAALHGAIDIDAVTAAWEDALAAPPWAAPSVWVHGDLSPGNVLVKGGRLVGVIDFGGVGLGDPACDLLPAWNLLPADARPAFRDALGADDATWRRGRGWALSVALIQLPYYARRNPPLAANARHVIAEVLADHGHLRSDGLP